MRKEFRYSIIANGNYGVSYTFIVHAQVLPPSRSIFVFRASNGWIIQKSSRPEIDTSGKIIWIKGDSSFDRCIFDAAVSQVIQITSALEEFIAKEGCNERRSHRLTKIFK